jgi:hypothetical protein
MHRSGMVTKASAVLVAVLLLHLSILDVLFPVPLPTLIRSRLQADPATFLILIGFFISLVSDQSGSFSLMWGVFSTASVVFLSSHCTVASSVTKRY